MPASTWDSLCLDTAVTPERLDEARFRQWLSGKRIFISSTMDDELSPYRAAIRHHLASVDDNVPIMWETISPVDCRPDQAFLDGVDRSDLFVLVLGTRYGVADGSGYSPTHKEANRASDRHLHRLLFTLRVPEANRDGKLNDWLRGLYAKTSGSGVATPGELVATLDARLRDLAGRAERSWIKLGPCVFPGRVEMTAEGRAGRTFRITARARDHSVRRAIAAMGNLGGEVRLTYPNESFPVHVERVREVSEFANEADMEIACRTPQNWYGITGGALTGMTINNIGPEEQWRQWADYAIFGKAIPKSDWRSAQFLSGVLPDLTPLPQVLTASRATGWQAEGVARLYLVEETVWTRGGHFSHLSIGPATSSHIPIEGEAVFASHGRSGATSRISGIVQLAN